MDRLLKPVHHRIWSNPERCVQKLLRFSEEHAALARQHGGDKLGPLIEDFVCATRWTERVGQATDARR